MTEETIDQCCTRLRQQAIICEFSDSEHEIKIHLVEACLSSRVRRKAIQEDLTFFLFSFATRAGSPQQREPNYCGPVLPNPPSQLSQQIQ